MESDMDTQIQVKKVPAFTVLKNGSILKNIFLLHKHSAVDKSPQNQQPDEQILLAGRHPNCNITLEHPSISRFHLRIHSNPSSQNLSVVDLSSVHGTWVSGKRIEPGVQVMMKEGDTVKMGGSTRVYELHWVPLSQAYGIDDQFLPAVYTFNQDKKHELYSSDDNLEHLDLTLSNKIQDSPLNPLTFSVPKHFSSDADVEPSSPLSTCNGNENIISTFSIQAPIIVSDTTSATEVSDSLTNTEDEKHESYSSDDNLEQLDLTLSNKIQDSPLNPLTFSVPKHFSSDTDVESSSPLSPSNQNENIISTFSIQSPIVVSDTTSATEVSDSQTNTEDQLNSMRDNLFNEFELLYHRIIKENGSKFSYDDTDEEYSSKSKSNENGEFFSTVSNQALLVSEAAPETEISDCLTQSEDQLILLDHPSNESVLISHGTIEDERVSLDLSNDAIQIDEKDKDQDEESSETVIDHEDEPEDLQKVNNGSDMKDGAAFMVLFNHVHTGLEFDSVDQEAVKKDSVLVCPDVTDMDHEEISTPPVSEAKEIHMNLHSLYNVSASDGSGLELYTPDKENRNPNASSGKSLSKKAAHLSVYADKNIFGYSQRLFATVEEMSTQHEVDPFAHYEEEMMMMDRSCNSINYPQIAQNAVNSSQVRWTIVVDTNSLLDYKSLKHLKLLEGIKRTRLFVPKIVVKELMDIKNQDNFFKRNSKKASLALKWIDECMMNTRWWIYVDNEVAVHSLTPVPKVLEVALHLCKEFPNQKIIIISDSLTMKVKAMAEGIMCETAEEFRRSLVNPFSERFMWVGSSARGLTWSCVDDDDIVKQKYYASGLNMSHRFKGLKLLSVVTCYN